jgi:hypothetical protein
MHIEVAIDISDPTTALPFYAEVLGYRSSHVDNVRYATDPTYFALKDPVGIGPKFIFPVVPEKLTVKNRMHLDFHIMVGYPPRQLKPQFTLAGHHSTAKSTQSRYSRVRV